MEYVTEARRYYLQRVLALKCWEARGRCLGLIGLASTWAILLPLPASCSTTHPQKFYSLYTSIQVGERMPENLDFPTASVIRESELIVEAENNPTHARRAAPTRESVCVVKDLDGTVLGKSYSRSRVRNLWWLLWSSIWKTWECEIVSPIGPIVTRTQSLARNEPAWPNTGMSRWLRTEISDRQVLPEGTRSLLQLLDLRAMAKRGSELEQADLGSTHAGEAEVDDFASDVKAISDLLSANPRNRLVRDLLDHVRHQGRFEGHDLRCDPLLKMKWFQVLGSTASRIRTTPEGTVVMTVEDSTHLSWVLFMLEGGWIIPLGVMD